jgi:hypothetical protein
MIRLFLDHSRLLGYAKTRATAGEQSLLAMCLFIKQWYCIQQANEQRCSSFG